VFDLSKQQWGSQVGGVKDYCGRFQKDSMQYNANWIGRVHSVARELNDLITFDIVFIIAHTHVHLRSYELWQCFWAIIGLLKMSLYNSSSELVCCFSAT